MSWQTLVKTALLGTEHSALPEETLQELKANGIDVSKEPPLVLLEGAAMYGQMRKAGFRLETYLGELTPAAETDAEKQCSLASTRHLELILNGQYEAVLPEFIDHLWKNGKCLPAELLPPLMRRTDQNSFRQVVQPALGSSGRWLLAQHPEWGRWLADGSKIDWQTASREERSAHLHFLRKNNPSKALQLLQSTWEEEDLRSKLAFLAEMEVGLSSHDELFLENCLDEKRKEVRQAAAQLLVKLPGSQLSERMYQRAVAMLGWNRGRLHIEIPDGPDESAIRDGIQKVHPAWKGGAKESYLGQVFSLVLPERWVAFFHEKPIKVLARLAATDWAGTFNNALELASVLFNDKSWIHALLKEGFEIGVMGERDAVIRMMELATPSFVDQDVVQLLKNEPHITNPVYQFLLINQSPWSDGLSIWMMGRFKKWLSIAKQHYGEAVYYKALLKKAALSASPDLFATFQIDWPTDSPLWVSWEKPISEMLETLLFRKEMATALSAP